MICTQCHQDDGLKQDFSDLPVDTVITLCRTWNCPNCLREQDDEAMQRMYDAKAADEKHVSAHDWDAIAGRQGAARPFCAVRGLIRPGAMCGSIIVGGKLCGFAGECGHQVKTAPGSTS